MALTCTNTTLIFHFSNTCCRIYTVDVRAKQTHLNLTNFFPVFFCCPIQPWRDQLDYGSNRAGCAEGCRSGRIYRGRQWNAKSDEQGHYWFHEKIDCLSGLVCRRYDCIKKNEYNYFLVIITRSWTKKNKKNEMRFKLSIYIYNIVML